MPRNSQSETLSGSPPTYRTRFPIEIPFVSFQLIRAGKALLYGSPLLFDSINIWTVLCRLQIVLSDRVECNADRYCSTVSLKRLVCEAGRKLEHRSRRIKRERT